MSYKDQTYFIMSLLTGMAIGTIVLMMYILTGN